MTRLIFLLLIFQLSLATSPIVARMVCLLVNWSAIVVAVHIHKDFEDRTAELITKLLQQAFTVRGLKAAFFKFIDSHILLAQKYGLRVLSLVDKIHS